MVKPKENPLIPIVVNIKGEPHIKSPKNQIKNAVTKCCHKDSLKIAQRFMETPCWLLKNSCRKLLTFNLCWDDNDITVKVPVMIPVIKTNIINR